MQPLAACGVGHQFLLASLQQQAHCARPPQPKLHSISRPCSRAGAVLPLALLVAPLAARPPAAPCLRAWPSSSAAVSLSPAGRIVRPAEPMAGSATAGRRSAAAAAGAGRGTLDLACLDGCRALASIWVVLLHCYGIWCFFVPYQARAVMLQRNALVR